MSFKKSPGKSLKKSFEESRVPLLCHTRARHAIALRKFTAPPNEARRPHSNAHRISKWSASGIKEAQPLPRLNRLAAARAGAFRRGKSIFTQRRVQFLSR